MYGHVALKAPDIRPGTMLRPPSPKAATSYTYLLTPWSRVPLEKLTGSAVSQEIPAFSEPEGSSPYPQVPATCPYPEPTASIHRNSLPLPEDPS
jgi:hypothetical protein